MAGDEKKGPEGARPRRGAQGGSGEGDAGSAAGKKKTPPAAGPHADPALVDEKRTPGAGTLPDPGSDSEDGDSVTG